MQSFSFGALLCLFWLSFCSYGYAAETARPAVCDPRAFGAHGDVKTKDTAAIQAAIDSCAKSGGIVHLHDGTFLTGMITLKSGITLKIEPTAILKGSQDDADYPDIHPPTSNTQLSNCRKALVYAETSQDIQIVGGGTIDGSGSNPKWTGKEATRPMAIFIAVSKNVLIEGIKVVNSGMWSVVNMEVDHLTIRNISVHSPDWPNRDGIDVVDCHHVLIEDSQIYAQDDALCLKSGSSKGVYDLVARNIRILHSTVANGLKLGTASTGSFKDVRFENIQIHGVRQAAMAVESVDGAAINNIHFDHIQIGDAGVAVYMILGTRTRSRQGLIEDVAFTDVKGTTTLPWGSAISGSADESGMHTIRNVSFKDFHLIQGAFASQVPAGPAEYRGQYPDPRLWGELPAYGLFVRHVDGVNFDHCKVEPAPGEVRQALVTEDVSGQSGSLDSVAAQLNLLSAMGNQSKQ